MRSQVTEHIIEAPYEELLSVSDVEIPAPEKARIYWKDNLQGMLPGDDRRGNRLILARLL
jgi:hypothetical protein